MSWGFCSARGRWLASSSVTRRSGGKFTRSRASWACLNWVGSFAVGPRRSPNGYQNAKRLLLPRRDEARRCPPPGFNFYRPGWIKGRAVTTPCLLLPVSDPNKGSDVTEIVSAIISSTAFAELARMLLGEPNRALSSEHELRYGARGSLSVNLGKCTWYDHEIGAGGGALELVTRETRLVGADRLDWLKQRGLHLFEDVRPSGKATTRQRSPTIVATYDYVDQGGELLFQVCRFEPKDFRQRRKPRPDDPPDTIKGGWVWSVKGINPVPYRLTDVIENDDRVICIVEGEKDVDRLWKLGLPATTNAGGAGKWSEELSEHFRGADVVIIPDFDPQKRHPKTKEAMFHSDGRPIHPGQDHAQDVAQKLSGVAKRVRVLELWRHWPAMPLKGDVSEWLDHGGTTEALYALIERTSDWVKIFNSESSNASGDDDLGEWDAGDDNQIPPPRGWLLGTTFCRGFASSLLGDGAVGKTAMRYAQGLSAAVQRSLTGEHVFQRCRVLIVSFEDGSNELRRRIRAACLHHKIDRGELKGWLYLAALGRKAGKLMALDQRNQRVPGTLAAKLARVITSRKIDLVIHDPFIKSPGIAENDNSGIDEVAQILTDMCINFDIAVDVPHHMSKGPADPGNANRGRGASALKDALRLVRTATVMTADEAKAFGLSEVERRRLIRVDDAKLNIAPMTEARWFRLVGVDIDNATELYPSGDNVQTVEVWRPPGLFADISVPTVSAILDEIDAGLPDGNRYSNAARSDRPAWSVVRRHWPGKWEGPARLIVNTWLKSGLLIEKDYENPKTRKPVKGLWVDHLKRPT
ncbi:AAA family ATPase [Bradyrhizobium sp. UFLA05-112]